MLTEKTERNWYSFEALRRPPISVTAKEGFSVVKGHVPFHLQFFSADNEGALVLLPAGHSPTPVECRTEP